MISFFMDKNIKLISYNLLKKLINYIYSFIDE